MRHPAAASGGDQGDIFPASDFFRVILARLTAFFGPPEGGLSVHAESPEELLVITILSQSTTDQQAARTFRKLREAYPRPGDLLVLSEEELASLLKPAGLEREKSGYILGALRRIHSEKRYWGRIAGLSPAAAQAELETLPGVGPKTAAVVLLFGFGKPVFPVDTHIRRIFIRLGLAAEKESAERIQRSLGGRIPEEIMPSLHLGLIRLGREICRSRRPRCGECPLREICPYPERSRS